MHKSGKYDKQINAWYELALHDENEEIQHHAADSLFGFYLRKKDYTKAEKYENIIFPAIVYLILCFPQWLDWHYRENDIGYAKFCQGKYRQLFIHWKWENIMSIHQCLILYVQGRM